MAAGVSRGSIAAQMLGEMLPVAAVALIAAACAAGAAAGPLGELLFGDIPAPLLSDQLAAAGATGAATRRDLTLDGRTMAALATAQIVTVVATTLAAAGVILRAEPRDILTRAR